MSNEMNDNGKEPALSDKAAKGIALAFASVIIIGAFGALAMLVAWGLSALWDLLFG